MGNQVSNQTNRKSEKVEITIRVDGLDCHCLFEYDGVVIPYTAKISSYNSEIAGVIKALEYLEMLQIDTNETVLYVTRPTINRIKHILDNRQDLSIVLHFSKRNIRLIEI